MSWFVPAKGQVLRVSTESEACGRRISTLCARGVPATVTAGPGAARDCNQRRHMKLAPRRARRQPLRPVHTVAPARVHRLRFLRRASRRWAPAQRSFASMSDVPSPRDMMRPFEDAARHVAPWIAHLARVGYVADAVLYGTIGFLAAEAAIRRGGETT